MKRGIIRKFAAFLLSAVTMTAAACAKTPAGTKTDPTGIKEEGQPLFAENTVHCEKINTEPTFRLPKKTEDRASDFTIPVLFTDGCVLQADMAVRLWGRCVQDGGIAVRVTKDEDGSSSVYYGKVENGSFELFIKGEHCGGPYTLEFISENGGKTALKDVLFGEVFVLAGQSNMGWSVGQCYKGDTDTLLYQDIIDHCYNPLLREMLVWPVSSETPVDDLASCRSWQTISPESVLNVSGTGYFFGRRFQALHNIPVGLVSACMGGIPLSQWVIGGEWYNGQVNPVKRMTVRGVLWYQGEGDPVDYGARLAAMIQDWRREFDNPGLLWATVQLPRFIDEANHYMSRDEDKKAGTLVDDYTYCVTLDTGLYPDMIAKGDTLNDNACHPYDKEIVGTRLADAFIAAFCSTGKTGLWTAPYTESAAANVDGSVTVKYANVGDGLKLKGKAGFEIAGADGVFYDAVPTLISKDEISLTCEQVKEPVTVRYGYKNFSSLIEEPITLCAQSVCVYNTGSNAAGAAEYTAEQFTISLK